jgi:hypothetical protein
MLLYITLGLYKPLPLRYYIEEKYTILNLIFSVTKPSYSQ